MKGKKILRVQPVYTMLLYLFMVLCFVFFLFMPSILKWDSSGIYDIIYYCLMGSCCCFAAAMLIYYIQFARVDSEGIVISVLFYPIAKVRWEDVHSAVCCKVLTYDNRTNVYLKWIVLKCSASDYVRGRVGRNKKNKSPLCIIATAKNIAVISQYIEITHECV